MIVAIWKNASDYLPVLNDRSDGIADDGEKEICKGEKYPSIGDSEYRCLLKTKEKCIPERWDDHEDKGDYYQQIAC